MQMSLKAMKVHPCEAVLPVQGMNFEKQTDCDVGLFFRIHSLHRQHSLARVNFHSLETHLHSNPLILLILSLASAIFSLLVSTGEDASGKFYIPGTKGIYFTPNGNKVESILQKNYKYGNNAYKLTLNVCSIFSKIPCRNIGCQLQISQK